MRKKMALKGELELLQPASMHILNNDENGPCPYSPLSWMLRLSLGS